MSTFYLIRHGNNDFVGKTIASWLPGVHLNREGIAQAEAVAARLAGAGITAIYSSPLERALETAQPLAAALSLKVHIRDAFGEIRFGEWTGCRIDELDRLPEWQRFNQYRSATRAPGGELMLEAQARMIAELEFVRERHRGQSVAVFSHGDVIRAAVTHYLGMPLDLFQRIEIEPASITTLELNSWGPRVVRLNEAVAGAPR